MAFFRICREDKVLSEIRKTFKATPLKVPSTIEKPLYVFAFNGQKAHPVGMLSDLLVDKSFKIEPETSPLSNVDSQKTRDVNTEIGLELLAGYLKGLNISDPTSINMAFKNASQMAFSFSGTQRLYVSGGKLGDELPKYKLNLDNLWVKRFRDNEELEMLIIDNTFVSNNFTVHFKKEDNSEVKIDFPAIQKALAEGHFSVKVSGTSDSGLKFEGQESLTFAFTCLKIRADYQTGRFTGIGDQVIDVKLKNFENPEIELTTKDLLLDTPSLLIWDTE